MNKQLITVLTAVGLATACTVGSEDTGENVHSVGQALTASLSGSTAVGESDIPASCFTEQRRPMMAAELAIAMARELGELHPGRDLTVREEDGVEYVDLSPEGMSRCDPDSNGCEVTRAILQMQYDTVNDKLDASVFSADAFRGTLVVNWFYQMQYEAENNLLMPSPHYLTLEETTPAFCGTDYRFSVNWLCTGCITDSTRIEHRMQFFLPNNSVIDFRSSDDEVIIDPTPSINNDGSATTASGCVDACAKRASSGLEGDCCECEGTEGILMQDGYLLLCDTSGS